MSPATEFKKGIIPKNTVALYYTRVNRDGHRIIKVPRQNPYTGANTHFVPLARWTWEQAHGPIPKAHAVIHIDGNKLNDDIDNLALLSRGELLTLNNPRKVPAFKAGTDNTARIALAKLIHQTHTLPCEATP